MQKKKYIVTFMFVSVNRAASLKAAAPMQVLLAIQRNFVEYLI
jgi:hypothetical protein